jgi:hypothetical protein
MQELSISGHLQQRGSEDAATGAAALVRLLRRRAPRASSLALNALLRRGATVDVVGTALAYRAAAGALGSRLRALDLTLWPWITAEVCRWEAAAAAL